ncbi:MAG: hypothetical protein HRU03_08735 [Nanoarchaeales archaeon]|nr:hypothetical protein [Nanoarchaeales archaeon]
MIKTNNVRVGNGTIANLHKNKLENSNSQTIGIVDTNPEKTLSETNSYQSLEDALNNETPDF